MDQNTEIVRRELAYLVCSFAERARIELERQLAANPATANASLAFWTAARHKADDALVPELAHDIRDL
jgi:hypothetical protein